MALLRRDDERAPQPGHHRGRPPRAEPRDAARGRLRRRRLRQADRRASPTPTATSRPATPASARSRSAPMAALREARGDAADLRHHHRQRRHLDGHRGHEVLARLARGDRRLDRDGGATASAMDGVLAIGGCDKNMPGALIAFARLDVPAIFVYGGTIKPGCLAGRDLTIVSVFEAVGQFEAGKLADAPSSTRSSAPRSRAPAPAAACTPPTPCPRRSRRSGMSLPALVDDGRRGRREGRERGRVGARAGRPRSRAGSPRARS